MKSLNTFAVLIMRWGVLMGCKPLISSLQSREERSFHPSLLNLESPLFSWSTSFLPALSGSSSSSSSRSPPLDALLPLAGMLAYRRSGTLLDLGVYWHLLADLHINSQIQYVVTRFLLLLPLHQRLRRRCSEYTPPPPLLSPPPASF